MYNFAMFDKLKLLPESNPEPIMLSDIEGNIIYKNSAAKNIFPNANNLCDISEDCKNISDKFDMEIFAENKKYYKMIGRQQKDEDVYLIYVFDITELKQKQNELEFLANYDVLTGLPNKNKLIRDMLDKINNKTVIMLIDIKSMRHVNSIYGYDIGDKLMIEFAKLLNKVVSKPLEIYRLYGNIFAIYDSIGVNCQLDSKFYLENIFNKLNDQIININNLDIPVQIRMGVASCEDLDIKDENYPLEQLKIAEIAVLEAKKNNRNILYYNEIKDIEQRYQENRFWLFSFKQMQKKDDCKLIPYFQPIINNKSHSIDKYEALMRLSIKGKIYTPDKFIDIANESGEIVNLTMIMINEVFKVVNNHNINVAINITPQDLRSDIITFLKEKISEYSINPEKINLELLENEDFYELEDRIIELKDLGFKISLDDFGSGFSNFSKLISMKIDFLKIDGSIIKNIHCDENTFQIVKNINEIGKTLGCKTIAEYVSSAEIFSKVIDIGIDYSQGYFFYKPSPKIT
ncbi:MAG: hypothetical protein JG762_940 [Deferribacteraceae bacterium]|nr:hypothetical protein [Deferribacteraceae bacterium]